MPELRQQYLAALGIDVWQRRVLPVEPVAELPADKAHIASAPVQEISPADNAAIDISSLDWTALRLQVSACTLCAELVKKRSQAVFGAGDQQAQIMIIGDVPSVDEDSQGVPLPDQAGQLLAAMLRAIGLQREQVYLTNIIKCRTDSNADAAGAVSKCLPYLQRQIALLQPRLIFVMGQFAAQQLLQLDAPLDSLRGRLHSYADTPLVVSYHPAYLLHSPLDKRKSWDDLHLLVQTLRSGRAT